MKGIFSVFDHKKWVFSYVVMGLSFWHLDSADTVSVLIILIPLVIGASSFEKSQWRKHGVKDDQIT